MSPGPAAVMARAPAKVNLGLRVAKRRSDGFHEIETLFATVEAGDTVHVRLADEGVGGVVHDLRAAGRSGEAVPAMGPGNLAWRAAEAYLAASGWRAGVKLELTKRLPLAAGLGGGSSDAGAVLRALSRLLPSAAEPAQLAAMIGSDVPFFTAGLTAAHGTGRGERLEAIDLSSRWLVLVHPGAAVAAADAYRWLARFGEAIDWSEVAQAWENEEAPRFRNDLQAGVFMHVPEVGEAWRALYDLGLASPSMSGSGGSCFALAPSEHQARRAVAALRAEQPAWWVVSARAPAGARWLEVEASTSAVAEPHAEPHSEP